MTERGEGGDSVTLVLSGPLKVVRDAGIEWELTPSRPSTHGSAPNALNTNVHPVAARHPTAYPQFTYCFYCFCVRKDEMNVFCVLRFCVFSVRKDKMNVFLCFAFLRF